MTRTPILKRKAAEVTEMLGDMPEISPEKIEENIQIVFREYLKEQGIDVIICSDDRDALNVASLGYYVIWLNSETATLTSDSYQEITKYCYELYNLPDID